MALRSYGGNVLQHAGLPGGRIGDYDEGDLRDLIESGLVRVTNRGDQSEVFELRRGAFDAYDQEHKNVDAPIAAQENLVLERVSSDAFAARYRAAFDRWRSAEMLLWEEESTQNLTDIGHRCREAIQLFVTRLIELHGVPEIDPNPAKTVNRLRAVIAQPSPTSASPLSMSSTLSSSTGARSAILFNDRSMAARRRETTSPGRTADAFCSTPRWSWLSAIECSRDERLSGRTGVLNGRDASSNLVSSCCSDGTRLLGSQ